MKKPEIVDEKIRRVSTRRWLAGNWKTQRAATAFFRSIWKTALSQGLRPGDPLTSYALHLSWLVDGHPRREELLRDGVAYFTFRPDGRGNHRFVVVGTNGIEHPFSTTTALTGFEHPLREPPRCRRCGMTQTEGSHGSDPSSHVFDPEIGGLTA